MNTFIVKSYGSSRGAKPYATSFPSSPKPLWTRTSEGFYCLRDSKGIYPLRDEEEMKRMVDTTEMQQIVETENPNDNERYEIYTVDSQGRMEFVAKTVGEWKSLPRRKSSTEILRSLADRLSKKLGGRE
jgi:hypothetical protein